MKRYILFTFFSLLSFNSLKAQNLPKKDTIFLDEKGHKVNRQFGMKKCLSQVSYCNKEETNDIIIYKANFNYYFGKLDSIEFEQLKELLSLKNKFVSNASIIVTYNEYKINNKNYLKEQKKCIKKLKAPKYSIPFYVYKNDSKDKKPTRKNSWIKDHKGILTSIFSKEVPEFQTIVLRSDGSYFLRKSLYFNDDKLFKLLNNEESWESFHMLWKKEKENPNINKNLTANLIYRMIEKRNKVKRNNCF